MATFGRRAGRFASRAAQGALLAAPSANPYVIGGAALLSGAPALFEEDRKFDPSPFRKGFRKYATAKRSAARRTADEAGSQAGTFLASKGMSNSPLAAGIAAGQRRLALQRTEDMLGAEEGQLEADLAAEQAEVDAANAQDMREDIQGVGSAALALTHNVATADSPLREALGLPKLTPDLAPIIIRTGGGDQGGGDSGTEEPDAGEPTNTPQDVTPQQDAERTQQLKAKNINPNSTYGMWYRRDPEIASELEKMLPPEMLQGLGLF